MRNATVNGIRQALNARGIPTFGTANGRKFATDWYTAIENGETDQFPVTEHGTFITAEPDRERVRVTVYAGRMGDASNMAARIRATLNDYAQSPKFGPHAGDATPTDATFYVAATSVDENYWDTVAEIITDRTDVCARDPYTGEHWHNPSNPYAQTCPGHNDAPEGQPEGQPEAAVATGAPKSVKCDHTAHDTFNEGDRVRVTETARPYLGRNYWAGRVGTVVSARRYDAGHTGPNGYMIAIDNDTDAANEGYTGGRSIDVCDLEHITDGTTAPLPKRTRTDGAPVNPASLDTARAILDAHTADVARLTEAHATLINLGQTGVTDCACCGMQIMGTLNRANYCGECKAHGGQDCPGSGAGIVFDTAWHCPGGVCDGTGCEGSEHMPTDGPDDDSMINNESASGPETIMNDTDATTDNTAAWFAANAGDRCATIGHSDKLGTHAMLIEFGGEWTLDTVCDQCARYYPMYASKVDTHTRAIEVPDARAIFKIDFHVDLSVWPIETTDPTDGKTRHPGAFDRTRYGYYVLNSGGQVLAAGSDVELPKEASAFKAATTVAGFIAASAEHANYNGDGFKDGTCAEHGVPYAQCSADRDVYQYSEEFTTFADLTDLHTAAMDRDMDRILSLTGMSHAGDAQAAVEAMRDTMRGAVNDFDGPVGVERWQYAVMIARLIGAQQGESAGEWVEINDADTAHKIIAGADEDIDPEVMDSIPSAPTGEWSGDFSSDALMSQLGLGSDDDSDDAELWTAYADAFDAASVAEVVRAARAYVA